MKKTAFHRQTIQALAETVPLNETKEFEGFYVGKANVKMPVRLIICHFTPAQHKKRLARMNEIERVKGIHYQAKTKEMSAYGMYITNLPIEIEKDDIYQIYSLHWQIELFFKVWKSTMHLAACKPMKIERLLCYFYSQLIRVILCTMMTYQMRYLLWEKAQKELSEMKGIEVIFGSPRGLLFSHERKYRISCPSAHSYFPSTRKEWH